MYVYQIDKRGVGSHQHFEWAKAVQDGEQIVLSSPQIRNLVAVRYNWGNSPNGNLFNKQNFRSYLLEPIIGKNLLTINSK